MRRKVKDTHTIDMFNQPQTPRAAMIEAVERVGENSDADWKAECKRVAYDMAMTHPTITSPMIVAVMEQSFPELTTHEMRAMGNVINAMRVKGWICDPDRTETHPKVRNHCATMTRWRSQLYTKGSRLL